MTQYPSIDIKLFNRELQEKLGILKFNSETIIKLPYKTSGSAAFDLFAVIEEPYTLLPDEILNVPTGIAFHAKETDFQIGLLLFIRSGVSTQLQLTNSVGLVDPDYQGQLILKVKNTSDNYYKIEPGERLAQAMFIPCLTIQEAHLVDEFPVKTPRGEGGFGHTGKF